jgi:glycosyltransferase involved in cell wall biosynthesis
MRILTLTNLYPNPFQPHRATFNRQQIRALAQRHPMMVISPILWTDELRARWRGAPRLPAGRRVVCDGIPVEHPRYLYTPKVLRSWYGHFFRWSVRGAFNRALASFRPDVIFAPWAYPDGWAALELGRRAGLPVVVKLHGSDLLTLDDYPARRRGTDEVLHGADGLVAVSNDLATKVAARGVPARRVEVIYDGVDRSLFHPGPRVEARRRLGLPEQGRIALFIGNLVPVKGLDVLIRACEALPRDFSCTFCLIGQGPLRAALERQAAETGVSSRAHFLGPRPHGELPDWYRAADLFVLPSRSEGVPTVLLEAAACGTPFVASRVGGVPEIAHLGANRLVPPGSPAELARAILEVLEAPSVPFTPVVRDYNDAAAEVSSFLEQVLADRLPSRGNCA